MSLTITGDRQEFVEYENIDFELTIKNETNDDLAIPDPGRALDLRVIDSNGRVIPRGVIISYAGPPSTIPLPPNGKRSDWLDFGAFTNDTTGNGIAGVQLMPGIYRAQTILAGVESNVIEFRITEPSALERQILRTLQSQFFCGKAHIDQAIEAIDSLMKQYPSSPYVPNMYLVQMLHCRNSADPGRYADLMMKNSLALIDKYPQCILVRSAISDYTREVKLRRGIGKNQTMSAADVSAVTDSLRALKGRYTSELIQQYIDEMIKRVEKVE